MTREAPGFAPTDTDAFCAWPTVSAPLFQLKLPTADPLQVADKLTMPPDCGRFAGLAFAVHEGAVTGVSCTPAWLTVTLAVPQARTSSAAHAVSSKVKLRAWADGLASTPRATVADSPIRAPLSVHFHDPTAEPVQVAKSVMLPPAAAKLVGFARAVHEGALILPIGAWVMVSDIVTHCAGTSALHASAWSL